MAWNHQIIKSHCFSEGSTLYQKLTLPFIQIFLHYFPIHFCRIIKKDINRWKMCSCAEKLFTHEEPAICVVPELVWLLRKTHQKQLYVNTFLVYSALLVCPLIIDLLSCSWVFLPCKCCVYMGVRVCVVMNGHASTALWAIKSSAKVYPLVYEHVVPHKCIPILLTSSNVPMLQSLQCILLSCHEKDQHKAVLKSEVEWWYVCFNK